MQDFRKKQAEVLDYLIDWTAYLEGDTIVNSTWQAIPSTGGITTNDPADTNTATTTTVWVGGGNPGQKYVIENTITTTAGRTIQDEITVTIKEVSS